MNQEATTETNAPVLSAGLITTAFKQLGPEVSMEVDDALRRIRLDPTLLIKTSDKKSFGVPGLTSQGSQDGKYRFHLVVRLLNTNRVFHMVWRESENCISVDNMSIHGPDGAPDVGASSSREKGFRVYVSDDAVRFFDAEMRHRLAMFAHTTPEIKRCRVARAFAMAAEDWI